MKKFVVLLGLSFFIILSIMSCSKENNVENKKLTIYAYDSFSSDWGPGPELLKMFEEKYGISAEFISPGDAVSVMQKVIMEKKSPKADILIGPDNNLLSTVLKEDILISYRPSVANKIPENLIYDKSFKLIPYDYGHFAICYDSELIKELPESLEDLTKEIYKDKLVLIDPRTSTPGMGFLLWTIAEYGDSFGDYWNRLKPSVLTFSDSWSKAYGLFTSGEAPMVLSYASSPVYHAEYEGNYRFKSLAFKKGNYVQIEGMGIVKGTKRKKDAKKFIDFMLSDEAQKIIAIKNIMFPVVAGVDLPESFNFAAKPEKNIMIESKKVEENIGSWIDQWLKEASK